MSGRGSIDLKTERTTAFHSVHGQGQWTNRQYELNSYIRLGNDGRKEPSGYRSAQRLLIEIFLCEANGA